MRYRLLLLIIPFFLQSCSTFSYLLQAGAGQMELFNRSKPLEEVLSDERISPHLRKLLQEVAVIKKFGESKGLKATPNYSDYIQLDRPYVVWVVTACRELDFEAKTWGFPIVGSFNYLGWFSEQSALDYASELKTEGWDIDVRGASAYSTLGWFKDPILSTMIHKGDTSLGGLVNVILHESVHATIYIENQSYFNESLASFVADHMMKEYFVEMKKESYFKDDLDSLLKAYESAVVKSDSVRKKLNQAYLKLKDLYSSKQSDDEKRAKKKEVLEILQKETEFKRPITNATLTQYQTYGSDDESFEKVLKRCNQNWTCFLDQMKKLKPSDFGEEHTQNFAHVFQVLNQ